jgi:hypothetical protein
MKLKLILGSAALALTFMVPTHAGADTSVKITGSSAFRVARLSSIKVRADSLKPGTPLTLSALMACGQNSAGNGGYNRGGPLVFAGTVCADFVAWFAMNDAVTVRANKVIFCGYNGARLDGIKAAIPTNLASAGIALTAMRVARSTNGGTVAPNTGDLKTINPGRCPFTTAGQPNSDWCRIPSGASLRFSMEGAAPSAHY